jgi:hypothetical protein
LALLSSQPRWRARSWWTLRTLGVAVAGSEAAACELAALAAVASAQAALVVVSAQPGFEEAALLAVACVQLASTGGL